MARVSAGAEAVYRGWMLRTEQYAAFADALKEKGGRLRTSAGQYRKAHELPGWYAALAAFTPASCWTTGTDRAAFDVARQKLGDGPAVLRDYSKSMKHYWHEAAYIPDLGDSTAAWQVAQRLRELRGDDLTGGYVLRRFEQFTGPELRTWWIDGVCRLVTAHPDTPDQQPHAYPELPGLADAVHGLGLPFVTVDLAHRVDGTWRVIELGDGQVSDRPATTTPETLIACALTPPEQ